jgi:hypothetical protein
MPLKIPHLLRCFDFLVMATYVQVLFIPRNPRALHLRHFERHQVSEVFAVRSGFAYWKPEEVTSTTSERGNPPD